MIYTNNAECEIIFLRSSLFNRTGRKIFIYQILMDYLWSVWTCIKEAQGDDFGTYGMDRYTRAIENLNKIDL